MIRAWRHPAADSQPSQPDPVQPAEPASLLPLVCRELREPDLAADQVLVRVEASVFGEPELGGRVACTPGGAAVGTVARAGQDATHLAGKRVLVAPEQACGECDVCRRAAAQVCPRGEHLGRTVDGTLATAVLARARWVCVLDGELSGVPGLDGPAAALVAREAAWAYAMFARAGVAPGEPVVIVGDNVVARFLVQVAVAKGVQPMVVQPGVVQPGSAAADRGFADWIQAQGGVAVEPQGPGAADTEAARRATRAAAERGGHGQRPWYLFATSAGHDARLLALALAGPGARLTMLARRAANQTHSGPAVPADAVLDADGVITGVAGAHPDLLPEVAALVVRGELDVAGAADLVAPDELTPDRVVRSQAGPPRGLVVTLPRE